MVTARSVVDAPHTSVHRAARRLLEPAQDLLVLGVAMAILALRGRTLVRLAGELFAPILDFRIVIAEVPFTLVMVEVVPARAADRRSSPRRRGLRVGNGVLVVHG